MLLHALLHTCAPFIIHVYVSSGNSQPLAAPPASSSMAAMYGTLASIVTSASGSSTLPAAGIPPASLQGQPLSHLASSTPNMLKPPPLPARRQVSHPTSGLQLAITEDTSRSHPAVQENAEVVSRQEAIVTESRSAPSSPVEQHRPFPLAPVPVTKSSALPPSQRPKSVFIHNSASYTDVLFSTDQAARPVVHSSEASVGYSSVQLDPTGKGYTAADLGKRHAATLATVSEDWQTPESNYDVPPPPVPARTYNTKADIAAAAAAMASVSVPPPILMMTNLPGVQPFGGGSAFSDVFDLSFDQTDAAEGGFEQTSHFSGKEGNGKGTHANGTGEQNPGDPFNANDPFEQMGRPNDPFDPFKTSVPKWDDPASFYDHPPPSSHMRTVDNDPKWNDICQTSSSPLPSLGSAHNGLSSSPPSAKPIEDNDCTGESYEDVANFMKKAQERDAALSSEAIFVPVASSVFQVPTVEESLATPASPQETYDFPAALVRHQSWEMLNNAPAYEEECVASDVLSGKGSFETLQDQKLVFEGNGFRPHMLQQSEPSQLPLPPPRQPDHPTNLVDQMPIPLVRYPDQLPPLPSKGPYDQCPPLPAPRSNAGSSLSPARPRSREETIVELCAIGYSRNDVVRAMAIASNDYHLAKKILQEFGHR